MATYATLTVPVADIIGADFDASRASVWIEPNTPVIIVDGTHVRVGGRSEQVVAGVATFGNLVTTSSADNPTTFGYRVTITAPPKGARDRSDIVTLTTSDFPLTGDANLAAISAAWDGITLPPNFRNDFRTEMEAIRDGAAAIVGPVDGTVEALLKNTGGVGPLSKAALTGAIHAVVDPFVTDQGQRVMAALAARDRNVNIAIAGDSTADATEEWPYVLGEKIAAAYPHLSVIVKNWNPATVAYYVNDLTIQTGTGPTRTYAPTRKDTFKRTVADIIGTPTEVGATNWTDGGGAGAAAGNWSADGTSALAGAHTSRAPILVSTGQQGNSRTKWTYTFGALTGARQVDLYARRSNDSNRLTVSTSLNADTTVYLNFAKRVAGASVNLQTQGNVPMPADRTFTTEVTINVNADGTVKATATVTAGANVYTMTGTLSAADWTAVNGGFNQGLYVVNGTPTGDRWKLFEFGLLEDVFPQQVFTIYNGSAPGTTVDYQTTNLATMYPPGVVLDQIWVASSHNETTMTAPTYLAKIETFLNAVRATHPDITVLLSSQNPEFRPGMDLARIGAHRARMAAVRAYAAAHRHGYVPVIEKWEKQPDAGISLVGSDGLHPGIGDNSGSDFWGQVAYDYLAQYIIA